MVGQSGPLILDNQLQPVWFNPVPTNEVAGNLSLQTYNGKPVLAWWQGVITNTGATESGEDVIVNQHYQPVATLTGKDGWVLTLHELVIRGNDAWVTANKNLPMNLSRVRRRVQRRADRLGRAGVRPADRQADPQLGRAQAHPAERLPGVAADERLPVGRLPRQRDRRSRTTGRSSSRCATPGPSTRSNIATGKIVWTLGGRHSSFKLGPGADFQWQHDVDGVPGLAAGHDVRRPLLPDHRRRHVRLADRHLARARAEARPDDAHRDARRPVQPRRRLRLRVHGQPRAAARRQRVRRLGLGALLLRVQRLGTADARRHPPATRTSATGRGSSRGSACRSTRRAGAARRPAGRRPSTRAGTAPPRSPRGGCWRGRRRIADVVATHPKSGFETAIPVGSGHGSFEVQALDARGRVIGTSGEFAPSR